jgi:hypothetical protein
MKGMGYITIGYAVERLPHHPLSFLTSWYPTGLFRDAHKIKASRIVDLAKQAIYHEVSTPCDMTSAHKALILIAGPSHELSMKGYMTVRKWIDRSIAGLETRSGDYPVMNTKNVAIIIMLSGLENIPRLTELKEIQSQYKSSRQESLPILTQSDYDTISSSEPVSIGGEDLGISPPHGKKILKDEMLVLPLKSSKNQISPIQDSGKFGQVEEDSAVFTVTQQSIAPDGGLPRRIFTDLTDPGESKPHHLAEKPHIAKETIPLKSAGTEGKLKTEEPRSSSHRVVALDHVSHTSQSASRQQSRVSSVQETPQNKKSLYGADSKIPDEKQLPHKDVERIRTKEMERQIIERELLRQRTMVMPGQKPTAGPGLQTHPVNPSEIIRLKREIFIKTPRKDEPERFEPADISSQPPENRTVIIRRKRVQSELQETQVPEREGKDFSGIDDDGSIIMRPEVYSRQADSEVKKIDIKNFVNKSKDHIFEGKGVQGSAGPQIRDSALIHTDLKTKKNSMDSKVNDEPESIVQNTEAPESPDNREKNTSKKDNISWI